MNLDFQAGPPKRRSGVFMLAAGMAALAAALMNYHDLTGEAALREAEIAKARGVLERKAGSRRGPAAQEAPRKEEIAAANEIIHQLTMPWEQMFSTFELATSKDIALLSMEPDPKKKMVRVTAESKTTQAMLAYIRRLEKSVLLDDVVLLKHEVQLKDPEQPVRFVVTSAWRDGQ
ncbi:hypothetical protein [Noviherbaspirillum massiliense]|uniref:hypothetical protein n=1 Tax=Noviherbaspirillum massiliense TaxID=1465823 RepID=UPI0011DDDD04|nr:hypothetical protein [Noviherbaspirillum massiliense]